MGRGRRRRYYGKLRLLDDKQDLRDVKNQRDFLEIVDTGTGASSVLAYEENLIQYNERGEAEIDRSVVERGIKSLQREVISAREYDKDTFTTLARDVTGLPGERAALNATNREYQVRARLVLAAARFAKVPVTPADKRVLNPLAEGRFTEVVYGKEGKYEGGTLATRLRANRNTSNRYRDPAQRARAQEQLKYLKGQEWREQVRYPHLST